ADSSEEFVDFVFSKAGAVVHERQRGRLAGPLVNLDGDFALVLRIEVATSPDGVDAVLQQFAHEYFRAAVKVVRQQIDQATQVYLKFVFHRRFLPGHRSRAIIMARKWPLGQVIVAKRKGR